MTDEARDSARSLAVLRRLMPAAPTRVPAWAKENGLRSLIAALLAGAWDESVDGDKAALGRLAGKEYEAIASELAPLVGFLERPLRKAGAVWKVASPRDAWFRLAQRISPVIITSGASGTGASFVENGAKVANMQGRPRQSDADRAAHGEPLLIVNEILLLRLDGHRIAIKAARIRALNNLAMQYEAAIGDCVGIA